MVVKNLRDSRESLDLKQKDIAELFKVNFTTVSGWETGKDTIPLKKLVLYANKFEYSLDYLFGITNRNTKYKPLELDLDLIAHNLKEIRKKYNFTQKGIAEKLNTTQPAYSHYETATNLITTTFLYNLIKIYKSKAESNSHSLSIDELLGRKKK